MGLANMRASKRLQRRRAAKKAGCAELSLAPRGKTKHAKWRLEERLSASPFSFSVRTLRGMKHRREVTVEPAVKGRLSLISEKHRFKVVTDRHVRRIITVCKL